MKVLLVNPTLHWKDHYSFQEIPLGLAYLQSAARGRGHSIEVLDLQNTFPPNDGDAIAQVECALETMKPDVIGVTSNTFQSRLARKIVIRAKHAKPRIQIVVGGVHATFEPETFFAAGADFVVLGEGEFAFCGLLESMGKESMAQLAPGVLSRDSERRGLCTQPSHAGFDIDRFRPDYQSFLDVGRYDPITVILSRGCAGRCSFCSSSSFWGPRLRTHSARWLDEVLGELALRRISKVVFVDDSFFANPFLYELIEVLKSNHARHRMFFAVNTRLSDISLDTVEHMRSAGIRALSFGVEGVSANGEPIFAKARDPAFAESLTRRCQQVGVRVRISWILGLPEMGADLPSYARMATLMRQIASDDISIHWFVPLPGTKYWARRRSFIVSDEKNTEWCNYNALPTYEPTYLSEESIARIQHVIWSELEGLGYSGSHDSARYVFMPGVHRDTAMKRSVL